MIENQCDDVFFALASYSANREVVLQKASDPLVRLIAALPFLAHCSHPQRIAILHTNAYFLMAQKGRLKTTFSHDVLDDENLMGRLHPLNCFYDGKYNPVNSGAWQTEIIRKKLISEIESIPNPEMEQIFPLEMAKKENSGSCK